MGITTPDKGNPNFFKIFKGKFEVELADGASSTNHYVMMTCLNQIQFIGNYTSNSEGLIGTLPTECSPKNELVLPCFYSAGGYAAAVLYVASDGMLTTAPDITIMLEGLEFNVSDKYY